MKLNTKNTIFVGFAFLLICMFWQVYDNIIAKMLIDSFGLNQTWSGFVMALDNIFAIVLLPVFGALSDKTKTKYGRRTPYIFIGTILAAILIVCVSLFDNMQKTKLKEANVPAVETVEVVEEYKNLPSVEYYEAVEGKKDDSRLVTKELNKFAKGDKLYRFNNKLYDTKELAVDARTPYVIEVRKSNLGFLIAFLVVLCLALVAMSVFRTPAVSLMPDVTPKPLRSKANAIINLMGSAGGILALGFMTFLAKDYQSYTLTFVVLAVLMIVFLGLFMWKVNEKKLVAQMKEQEEEYGIETFSETDEIADEKMPKDVKKSFILILLSIVFWYMAYNAATSKFSVYATNVLDTGFTIPLLVAQAAAIISYIPIGIISSKVGRKKTVLVGVVILFAAFVSAIFVNEKCAYVIWVSMALAGIGWATINVNSYPMVVEMSKGANVGRYTGIYYTASMAAQIITPLLSGVFMDIFGMRVALFPYCAILSACAFVTMSFVKHGDSKPIPTNKLEAFEAMDD